MAMGGTKLTADKAHRDGSPTRRNRTDVASRNTDPQVVQAEEKQAKSDEMRGISIKKSKGTPMKMLMAQEMSKETESRRNQPNIVARLMGLDVGLPTHQSPGEKKCKDVYEVWRRGQYDENQSEKRMALVHQKFIEAKQLASDEKLLQSKEFQSALEVLSSNRDLFLKFLEEPNSLLSIHLKKLQSIAPAPQTKRITILRPSRKIETMSEKQVKKEERSSGLTQPTRIVVLKPGPGKIRDSVTTQFIGSREEANDVAQKMRENLCSIRRDDSLLSSVPSNGYAGDEEGGDFSDSEIATLPSRHSWEFSDRFGSPEPLMIREAKKRLLERNGGEQMEVQRSFSTLGEMFAISDLQKDESLSTSLQSKDEDCGEKSLWSLSRSESVPVSSSYDNIGLKTEVPNSQVKILPPESAKSKSWRLSFTGKISSLFFSKSKKGRKEKSVAYTQPEDSRDESINASSSALMKDESKQGTPSFRMNESSLALVKEESKQGIISFKDVLSVEKPSTSQTPRNSQNGSSSSNKTDQNQDQPSPTSVLDLPFLDNTNNSTPNSSEIPIAQRSSVPIASLARLLSWDDTSGQPITLPKDSSQEEGKLLSVQVILSKCGFDNEKVTMMFKKWHSVDSPLNTDQIDKFLDRKEENAKSRERRSNQRLLFDCVNSALFDIGKAAYLSFYPWPRACSGTRMKAPANDSVEDEVWELVRHWFSCEIVSESGETDNGDLVVDTLLKEEIGGNRWLELMQSEIDEISKEIGGQILEELVEEALSSSTVMCLL